jgi:nucleotide-binding universal stress UspA family protein
VTDVWTHEEARDYLSKASEIVRGQGFAQAVLVLLRSRDGAYAIIDYAETHDVDHIVVGSRGAGGIKRFETGSVSDEVIRKSYCPVTIVP